MKVEEYGQMMFNLGILFITCQAISNTQLRVRVLDEINRVLDDLNRTVKGGEC